MPQKTKRIEKGSEEEKNATKTVRTVHGNGLATVTSIGIVCQQMGKVSMAVRSAAMSHIEPRLTTILGRVKMRRNLAKIVVILLLCGSGEARPQKTGESATTKPIVDQRKPAVSSSTAANIQDSRYTWNSGSSRVPYIHFYHDSVNRSFTGAEVSVDESTGSKSLNPFNYSESEASSNDSIPAGKPIRTNRMLKIFHGEDRNDPPRSRNSFPRTVGPVLPNFASKSDHDRSLSPKIPRFDGSTEIGLNNSPKGGVARVRDPGFSVVSAVDRVKVDPSAEFDHVAAIRKITDMLTQQSVGTVSSKVAIDPVGQSVPPPRGTNASNRHHSSSKRANSKNKPNTRPPSTPNKNKKVPGKSKIRNKTNSSRPLHWKNWPNGAIQSANDYQNYEKYTSSVEDLKPEETAQKPVPQTVPQVISLQVPQVANGVNHLVPIASPDLQEIVHWLKIPAFMPNGSHILESNEANNPVSVAFDPVYQNLQPNRPLRPSDLQGFRPGLIYTLNPQSVYMTEKPSGWLGNTSLKNKTQSDPQNQGSVGTKRPVSNGKPILGSLGSTGFAGTNPLSHQLAPSTTTQKPGPNVHIGFTSYEDQNKVPDQVEPQPPLVTYDQRCPTILINSYTRINNTVQSKEGCTDLNIIINSHVFNTNTYKSTGSPLDQVDQGYGAIDKYGTGPSYQPVSPSDYYGPLKDPVTSASGDVEGSNVQVHQGTHINILVSGPASEAPQVEPTEPVNDSSNDPSTFDATPSTAGVVPNDDTELNSEVQPGVDPITSQPPGSSSPSTLTPASSSASNDDEDDDLDLSPTGLMESIASVFAYFTYVNPLHYGFFSVAAAPFTALAAGVLGMVTFFFPWLFPSSFGFGRANNDAAGFFWHNVEDVVRQSMEKYGRLNEWKSRRKKRKR